MFWNKVWNALPYVLLYVASIVVIGVYNLLSMQYLDDIWYNDVFWNRMLSQSIANGLVLSATIMLFLSKLTATDKNYLKLKGMVDDTVINDVESDIGVFIFDENVILKKAAYVKTMRAKINKKEIKAKPSDLKIWYYGTQAEKEANKYCKKREAMEFKTSDEYLDRNILAIKQDYDEIDRDFVETGEVKRTKKKNAKQDSVWKKLADFAPRFLLGMAGAVFFNAFTYGVNEVDASFWYQFAFSLMMLVWMFINGRMYSFSYMAKILMVDLNTRYNILKNYLTWKVSKKKEVANGNGN